MEMKMTCETDREGCVTNNNVRENGIKNENKDGVRSGTKTVSGTGGAKKTVVGILAHVDAGKTTLAESLLYISGSIRKAGRVDHRDTFLDTDAQERARGITIFSKQAEFSWKDTDITLLDTQ